MTLSTEGIGRHGRPLVIGVGNPFRGDVGAGPDVITALRAEGLADDIDLVESDDDPQRLLDTWDGRSEVIVVDTVQSGRPPGTVEVIDLRSARPAATPEPSASTGLVDAITEARRLGQLPAAFTIISLEGTVLAQGLNRSPAARAATIEATRAVRQLCRPHD